MSDDQRPDLHDPKPPEPEQAATPLLGTDDIDQSETKDESPITNGRPGDAAVAMTAALPAFELSSGPDPESDESPVVLKHWAPPGNGAATEVAALLPAKSGSGSIALPRIATPLPQFAPIGQTAEVALASHRRHHHHWELGDEFVPGEGAAEAGEALVLAPVAGTAPPMPEEPRQPGGITYAPRPVGESGAVDIDQPLRQPGAALRPVAHRSSTTMPAPALMPSRWAQFATPAAWLGLALLLVSAVVPWLSRTHEVAVTPDHATLHTAADRVAKDLQPGDALAFTPDWGAHEAGLFDTVWRSKGLTLDNDLLFGDPFDLWTAGDHRRLWLVGTHGRFDQANVDAVQLRKDDLGHGTVLALYQLRPSATVFDFRKQLASGHAKIRIGDDKAAWRDCPWRGDPLTGRHGCGGAEYQDVWQGLHEVGGTRRECIFVHPPGDHGTLRLEFGALPVGTALQGRLGNRLWAVRHGDTGTPVRFSVYVGGQRRWEKTLATDDFTYQSWSVPLTAADAGKDVAFEVYADQEAWREACFDARLLGPATKP